MSLLTEKTRIPLGMVLGLLGTLIPGVSYVMALRSTITANEARVEKLERQSQRIERTMADVEQHLAVMGEQLKFQTQILDDLKDDLRQHHNGR